MASFTQNDPEKDTSPLLPSSSSSFTPSTFTSYVSDLVEELSDCAAHLRSLRTPSAKRSAILEAQKNAMSSFAPTWEDGRADLARLIVADASCSATYGRMNTAIAEAYLDSVMRGSPPAPPRAEGDLSRDDILTFLDLCTSYVASPIVASSMKEAYASEPEPKRSVRAMNERLVEAQNEVMEALGYEREWCTLRLQNARDAFAGDARVVQRLDAFVSGMVDASRAVASSFNAPAPGGASLDDGTTRVTKVTSKELDSSDPVAPDGGGQRMADRGPSKVEIATMKQMAVMEQDVLAELLSLGDAERGARVAGCRALQAEFLQQAGGVPVEERANFMLCVSPEVKRALIMVRVWEDFEMKRGGRELVREKENEM